MSSASLMARQELAAQEKGVIIQNRSLERARAGALGKLPLSWQRVLKPVSWAFTMALPLC